jgi:hypothetical protein
MSTDQKIVSQIDEVLNRHRQLSAPSKYSDCSDRPESERTGVVVLMCDCIRRFAPADSQYFISMQALIKSYGATNPFVVPHLAGILNGLRTAYSAGYLSTISELIHAEMFADFLEMAEYLLGEGYKDPAAVIVGSVLEEHLRALANRNGIPLEIAGKPKKADQLNADLAGKTIYSKLDQKSITSWLDLRNKAAHGKYTEYTKEQVQLQLNGIQEFMKRNPA